jgi:hypothetical protein
MVSGSQFLFRDVILCHPRIHFFAPRDSPVDSEEETYKPSVGQFVDYGIRQKELRAHVRARIRGSRIIISCLQRG